MARSEQVTIYQFDELDDCAKEKARDWWRQGWNSVNFDYTLEDAVTIGEILGIEFETRSIPLMGGGTRKEPVIYYSVSYSQGDGACFEGRYSYAKGAAKRIREYAPQDKELHRIADELQAYQRPHFYQLWADCAQQGRYFSMSVDVCDDEGSLAYDDEADEGIRQALRDFAHWIYCRLRDELDYQMSDENVEESIRCNEYEFFSDGSRA